MQDHLLRINPAAKVNAYPHEVEDRELLPVLARCDWILLGSTFPPDGSPAPDTPRSGNIGETAAAYGRDGSGFLSGDMTTQQQRLHRSWGATRSPSNGARRWCSTRTICRSWMGSRSRKSGSCHPTTCPAIVQRSERRSQLGKSLPGRCRRSYSSRCQAADGRTKCRHTRYRQPCRRVARGRGWSKS